MEIIVTLRIEDNWMLEPLSEWDCSRRKFFNWLGIVTRDEDGNNKYTWLKHSHDYGEYFNVSQVKKGDILYSGSKNISRNKVIKTGYYGVLEKTDDKLKLVYDTSYYKIKDYLKSSSVYMDEDTEM